MACRQLIPTVIRFCLEAALDPDELLRKLTAADVKAWFDWIKDNFQGSIRADGTLANYWRTLKRLYYLKNGRDMDPDMRRDCLNVCGSALLIFVPVSNLGW
jgi:hypothetical protein